MFTRAKLITTTTVAAMSVFASPAVGASSTEQAPQRPAEQLRVLELPSERLERSIDVHVARLDERRETREPDFASPESFGVSLGTLETIASCESGADPAAVSSDGTYRG